MSGNYPATIGIQSIDFQSRYYNVMSESISGRTQSRHLGGHRFEFTANYTRMDRQSFAAIQAFYMKQKGSVESFQFVLPEISYQTGDAAGTVLAAGGAAIGDTDIDVDGITGTLKAGDVIKFAGHSKVYMITDDVTAAAGAATVSVQPPLISAVADDEGVVIDAVPFTVRFRGDLQQYSLESASLVSFDADFIEAV